MVRIGRKNPSIKRLGLAKAARLMQSTRLTQRSLDIEPSCERSGPKRLGPQAIRG